MVRTKMEDWAMNNTDAIEKLLDTLNAMFPIKPAFRRQLRKILKKVTARNRTMLLRKDRQAKKAWQLLSGYIIGFKPDEYGNELVDFIYYPGEIVTDMRSFFEGHLMEHSYRCIGEVELLELKKKDFYKMAKYPETTKLAQHLMMVREKIMLDTVNLLKLDIPERVKAFVRNNPIADLPSHYAASFLGITETEYIEHAIPLLKMMEFNDAVPVVRKLSSQPTVVAHEVRAYILENFMLPTIGNSAAIAKLFNTNVNTLFKEFKTHFQLTVHRMIVGLRMEEAQALLKNQKIEVNKVARAVGYNDTSTFRRVFKKYYGYPPKETGNL